MSVENVNTSEAEAKEEKLVTGTQSAEISEIKSTFEAATGMSANQGTMLMIAVSFGVILMFAVYIAMRDRSKKKDEAVTETVYDIFIVAVVIGMALIFMGLVSSNISF